MLGIYTESKTNNPYENLAMEEYWLHYTERKGTPILYIWQNEKTVVIGRNQNAYTECDMRFASANNITVVRRITGGGAVYHDLGNINFSIILPKFLYNISRSTKMIVSALNSLGIYGVENGRNDICLGEKKISGNAYYSNELVGLHHGTLLYEVDTELVSKVLSVQKCKLTKRGILSISSRVAGIHSYCPDVSLEDIKNAIKISFSQEYGVEYDEVSLCKEEYIEKARFFSSDDWVFGKNSEYQVNYTKDFPCGLVTISLDYNGNMINDFSITSDSLDIDKVSLARDLLRQITLEKINLDETVLVNRIFEIFTE